MGAFPGPAGPAGPEGPQGIQGEEGDDGDVGPIGPAGAGTTFAFANTTTIGWLNGTCRTYAELEVTIDVPSSGHVVASAMVSWSTETSQGNLWAKIATSPTDCTQDEWLYRTFIGLPSVQTLNSQRVEAVTPGSHTFYVNALLEYHAGPEQPCLKWGNIVVVFYPSYPS
jgi:hypothetical protein